MNIPYDLKDPRKTYELPNKYREISGICPLQGLNSLAFVQDERNDHNDRPDCNDYRDRLGEKQPVFHQHVEHREYLLIIHRSKVYEHDATLGRGSLLVAV